MGTLAQEITSGLIFEENDLTNPVFTLGSTDYACIPSVNEMARDLDVGGFVIDKMLTAVVRLLDESGNTLYDHIPQSQEVLTYNGEQFRIINVKTHPTQTYVRITAMGVTRGL